MYPDIELVGVYSDDREATESLTKEYGVYVAGDYRGFIGKLDGVMITSRHGDDHYRLAKEYILNAIERSIKSGEEEKINTL